MEFTNYNSCGQTSYNHNEVTEMSPVDVYIFQYSLVPQI
jgi:hypothetical protein